ncbi:MAG: hypothetical protein ACXVII_34455 [Solirubrobacteraceae bacterium]
MSYSKTPKSAATLDSLVEVHIDPGQGAPEVQASFVEAGVSARVIDDRPLGGNGDAPYIVHLLLQVPLEAFVGAVGTAGFTALQKALKREHKRYPGWMNDQLEDSKGRSFSDVAGLPPEAIEALTHLDWTSVPTGGWMKWEDDAWKYVDSRDDRTWTGVTIPSDGRRPG